MSQIVTRKGPVNDDKEKRQTDSPVKDMKKKVAANAEKEKQADKPAEKPAEKPADKPADKKDKPLDKAVEKKNEKRDSKGAEKPVEQKAEKAAEKKTADKQVEKKDDVQKPKDDSRGEKSDKADKPEDKKKPEPKPKQNGQEPTHNGTVQSNGNKENGTVSSDDEDHNDLLVIEEQDEMFPELAYDDGSDVEVFEPPTPESVPSRSLTRRSQAKVMRTPETPRPASDKPDALPADDSKEPKDSKGLKPKEDPPARNLRSSDSPKSLEKREGKEESEKAEGKSQEPSGEKIETDIVIDVEAIDDVERRKTDTNFSKSRVKVSPYRRSVRLDNTTSSMAANYTGNNTTLEMDVTESFTEDTSLNDSYLAGLKQIRSRLTHQPLKDMQMRRLVASRTLAAASSVSLSEQGRPTVTVVGRKRKPESESTSVSSEPIAGKRARIFDRISLPFRRVATQAAPEIVGVNTDLPLTAPIVATETFDPETIKQSIPLAPVVSAPVQERERKCIIM